MARHLIDRSDDLYLPLERRQDRASFIAPAQHRHRLPKPLAQLGARGGYVPPPHAHSQGAVVKAWLAAPGSTTRFLRYLERGKGLEGVDAGLFTDPSRPFDRQAFARDAAQDPHQHRLIVSLATDTRVDLEAFTIAYLRQVEHDLGTRLHWVAAVHYDTGHRHVHVVVRGRDGEGQAMFFRKPYWLQGLRYRAQALATRWLGPTHRPQAVDQLDAKMTDHMWESRHRPPSRTAQVSVSLPTPEPLRPQILTPQEHRRRLDAMDAQIARLRAALAQRGRGKGLSR